MNLLKIIDNLDLDKIDQEEYLKPALRRGLFKKASDFSLKLALTSVPFALIAMPKIVQAQSATEIAALSLALKLEYLESDFYTQAQAAMVSGALPNTHKAVFDQIQKHESAHVNFLKTALGASAPAMPTFDFTASTTPGNMNGPFSPFTVYADFLALAQAFEDTGVRAYKGQAGNLMNNNAFLTAALQIHSVEARHASEVRRIRASMQTGSPEKGWITGSTSSLPAALQGTYGAGNPAATYPSEDNVTQGGVNLDTALNGAPFNISHAAITEAFDEPLDTTTIVAVFNLFCYGPNC